MDKQLTAVLHCNTALGILRSSLCNSWVILVATKYIKPYIYAPSPTTQDPPPPPTSPAPLQKQPGTKTSLRQSNEPNCVKAMEQSAIPSTWWTWSPVHRAPCVAPSGHQSCWSQPPGVGSWLAPPQTGRWGTAHPCTTRAGRPVGSAPSEEATEQ